MTAGTNRPRFVALAAALLSVLSLVAAGGCGGGATGSSSSGAERFEVRADTTMQVKPKLSRAKFIAKAESICREAWPAIRKDYGIYGRTEESGLSKKRRTAEAMRVTLMASIDLHIFDQIHTLGSPQGQKIAAERLIGAMQEAVERGQRLDPLYSVAEVVELYGPFNKRAAAYGLHDCLVNSTHLRIPVPPPKPPV